MVFFKIINEENSSEIENENREFLELVKIYHEIAGIFDICVCEIMSQK